MATGVEIDKCWQNKRIKFLFFSDFWFSTPALLGRNGELVTGYECKDMKKT